MKTKIQLLILLFLSASIITSAQLKTAKVFGDNAILQRDIVVPVWGWGESNQQIKVTLNNKTYSTKSDEKGNWNVELDPQVAGGPYTMLIESNGELIQYNNIQYGDVWLCSGQSNMEWVLRLTNDAENEIAQMNDPLLRHFKVPRTYSDIPESELEGGIWEVGDKTTVGDFTAVGYYFAKELRNEINVPIGLLNSSWGGSRIEPWISKSTLDAKHPEYSYDSYSEKHLDGNQFKLKYEKMFPGISAADMGVKGEKYIWASSKVDETKWKAININDLWEDQGYENFNGIGWYRAKFNLYHDDLSSDITIHLGTIDDSDQTFINGTLIGSLENAHNQPRSYLISKSLLKEGENVITVRVTDNGGGGGLYMSDNDRFIDLEGEDIKLEELDWKLRMGAYWVVRRNNQIPNILYNKMINPIIKFPVKGVIWYQGESNAGDIQTAYDYRFLLSTLIEEWRIKWQNPDLPFIYVQLANFQDPKEEPGNDGWAVIRESMNEVLKIPNTGQAVIIDLGEANDIHPRNKKDVGKRLALNARKIAYKQKLNYSSPMYASHKIDGNKVIISFDHIGDGLMAKDKYGYLKGFSIAGEDKKFIWAMAKIVNNKVHVYSDKIKSPVAVRYGWEINPADANLFSKNGLPAAPFRTDKWKLE